MRLDQRDRAKPPAETADSPLAHALAYAALGWHVFPVHWIEGKRCSCAQPSCDSPGKHPIWQVTPTGFKEATTDAAMIHHWWTQYPRANVAVRTGAQSGIWVLDVDVSGAKRGDVALEQLIDTHGKLPDTAVAYTGSGGRHYFFAYPTDGSRIGNRTNTPAPGIDVRGDGGYVVAPPSVHISGGIYEWEASSDPIEGQTIAGEGWQTQAVTEPATAKAPAPAVEAGTALLTREQVLELKSALGYIGCEDYQRWIQVGQALHASGAGQQAYGLWADWSRQSEKFNAEIQAKKWRGFGGDRGLNMESIFAWAQAAGWVNPGSNEYREWFDRNQAEIEKAKRQVEYRTVERRDVPVYRLPIGELREVEQWLSRQLPVYHPKAGIQATLALASTFASRVYQGADGTPAHLYLGIHAPSLGEVRKLKSLLQHLVSTLGHRRMVRGGRFPSAQSVYKGLLRSPSMLWVADDYGQMVQFSKRQPSGLVDGALGVVTEAYGARCLYPDPDMDPTWSKRDEEYTIYSPALSVLAMLSHEQLPAYTRRGEVGRGALEQILCVDAGEADYPDVDPFAPIPSSLVDHVKRLRVPMSDGNLADLGSAHLPVEQRLVHMPWSVKRIFAEADKALAQLLSGQRQWYSLAIGARQCMRRLAIVLAAWNSPEAPAVTDELAHWAADYVRDHLADFIDRLKLVASEDGQADPYQKVLETINDSGPEGISKRMLVHKCWTFRTMSSAKRGELISTMIDDEVIVDRPTPGGRGKVLVDRRFLEEIKK